MADKQTTMGDMFNPNRQMENVPPYGHLNQLGANMHGMVWMPYAMGGGEWVPASSPYGVAIETRDWVLKLVERVNELERKIERLQHER